MGSKFLKQTSQKEQHETDQPILAYFDGLVDIPEPKNLKHDDIKYIFWQFKRALGHSVIILEVAYMSLMGYLTAYYPFSKLHTEKLFHANHKKLRNFIHDLEKTTKYANMPIYATGGEVAGPAYIITAFPTYKMKVNLVNDLRELLVKKYEQIIISEFNGGIKIVIPQESIL
jgi:hypothetical protein